MPRRYMNRDGIRFLLGCGLLCALLGAMACFLEEPRPAPESIGDPALALRTQSVAGNRNPRVRGVVLVVIDTLRVDHVGAYGHPGGLTPELDALAGEGVRFERAIAPSSWTRSSVASILSGRHPGSMRVLGLNDGIAQEEVMLAERLREAGIQTLGISSNGNAGASYGFDQGFERFLVPRERRGYDGDVEVPHAPGVTRLAEQLLDEVDPDRPFFLFLHYMDPHDPYLPHPELMDRPEPPGRFNGSRKQLHELDVAQQYVYAPDSVPEAERPTEADYGRIHFLYEGEIKFVDLWLGRLFEAVKERGLWDDVMWVVTADHGEGLWDHYRRGHGYDLFEEQVHVPLLLRVPGAASAEVVGEPVSLVDIAPTVLHQFGLDAPLEVQGSDLMPLLEGGDRGPGHESIYAELHRNGNNHQRSVRVAQRKLIARVRKDGYFRRELYDLQKDPGESKNRYGKRGLGGPELEVRMEEWVRVLEERVDSTSHVPLDALDAETLKQLEALGYVDEETGEALEEEGH